MVDSLPPFSFLGGGYPSGVPDLSGVGALLYPHISDLGRSD
jgi:hypothetical protein